MSTSSSSLRPGWSKGNSGGRGFQPPPTVADRGEKGRSGSWGSQERGSANKFAALDDDDDGFIPVAGGKADDKPSGTSRSEAFRSSFGRQSSAGSKPSGRSLADLAARVPEPQVAPVARRTAARFTGYRSTGEGGNGADLNTKPDTKVIRYTRERLLSMRVVPKDNEIPELLNEMIGSSVISDTSQDPGRHFLDYVEWRNRLLLGILLISGNSLHLSFAKCVGMRSTARKSGKRSVNVALLPEPRQSQ